MHRKKFWIPNLFSSKLKIVYVEKSINRPVYQQQQEQTYNTQTQTQVAHETPNFDYRKFFDFGFFSNLAAGYGGPHAQQQVPVPATQTVYVEKQAPTIVKEVSYYNIWIFQIFHSSPSVTLFPSEIKIEWNFNWNFGLTFISEFDTFSLPFVL